MRYWYVVAVVVLAALISGVWVIGRRAVADAPKAANTASSVPRTPWGTPDLSGIWSSKAIAPLERPVKFGNREFLTDEEIAAIERGHHQERGRDVRAKRGTEVDVEGAYNNIFSTALDDKYIRTKRSSLIVDPPDGKIPALTPEAQKRRDSARGATARSPEAAEEALAQFGEGVTKLPYAVDIGRPADNPEDFVGIERCMGVTIPCIGGLCGVSRVVQGPESIMIYYEQGHGGGAYRAISLDSRSKPLASHVRQWLGSSIGHWEGDTLVVQTTNFTARTSFQGSSEDLKMTEHFSRVAADMILYRVTLEDPKSFARPWTFEIPLTILNDKENRIYESACYEGNYSMTSMLAGERAQERKRIKNK